MTPVILFRGTSADTEELSAAQKELWRVVPFRTQCYENLVIGRYSVLPFYKELEDELKTSGSQLINTHEQHKYIADFAYYKDVRGLTPRTWHTLAETDYNGPFVVKGKTNSRKHQWARMMYAADRHAAIQVQCRLLDDLIIGPQGLVFREYVPLVTYEIGMNHMRFTNEWRFFFLKTELLSYGYYWSEALHPELGKIGAEGVAFAKHIAQIISPHINFFVLDIAEKQAGGWILIEVNDAQMSGLSMNKARTMYRKLRESIYAKSDWLG